MRLKGKLIKPCLNSSGYFAFNINRKNYNLHVLVAEAFYGPRPKGMVVCHWDDDKTNNKASNLRYGSRNENMDDALRNGKIPHKGYNKGGKSHKLTKEQCEYIKSHKYTYGLWRKLSRELGVGDTAIADVWKGNTFSTERSPWQL